jgi:hypothetical protein
MAGTTAGGLAAAKTNLKNDPDFYKRIGAIGGTKSRNGGYATVLLCDCEYMESLHKKAVCSGYKGGLKSRRGKSKGVTYNEHI